MLRSGDGQAQGTVLNLSESGARVIAAVERFEERVELELELELPACSVRATARVAWQRSKQGRCEAGLHFEGICDEHRIALASFVASEPSEGRLRSDDRVVLSPPYSLKVRVRPRTSKASHYFKLVNLSEGGCLTSSTAPIALEVGVPAELRFIGPHGSFFCLAELVRVEEATKARSFAWRFVEIDRESFGELRKLLARGGPSGVKPAA